MFCPKCGTLAFPDLTGNIACTNYKCNYQGIATNELILSDGTKIDLAEATSSSEAETREFVIIDDDHHRLHRGTLTHDSYTCPKCNCGDVFFESRQIRSNNKPVSNLLTCKNCKHGWTEN